MTTTPTLDPERTDQMRTFIVVEAASSTALASPARRPVGVRRTALAGAAAAALAAGGLVVVATTDAPTGSDRATAADPTDPGRTGPPPAPGDLRTIAVERSDGWTTVRLVDIDADPDAVVADLVAAGFAAERGILDVSDDALGQRTVSAGDGESEIPTFIAVTPGEAGDGGLVGLSVHLPADGYLASPPDADGMKYLFGPTEDVTEGAVRFGADRTVSLRTGSDVSLVVLTTP